MCVFCDIAKKETPAYIVYETENVMAFLDHDPINTGHLLLIPKQHYLDVDELPTELLTELMITSQKLVRALKNTYHPHGCTIIQNGGMFNDVGHYHLHIFPRYESDGFAWTDNVSPAGEPSRLTADRIAAELTDILRK